MILLPFIQRLREKLSNKQGVPLLIVSFIVLCIPAHGNQTPKEIREEIRTRINQAQQLQHTNTEQGLEIIESAIEMADKHNIPELMAYARTGKALLNGYLGNHAIAVEWANKGVNIAAPLPDSQIKAQVLSFAGYTYMHADRPEEALFYYQQSQQIYSNLPEEYASQKQDILTDMSDIYMTMGQYDQVLRLLLSIEFSPDEFTISDARSHFYIADAYLGLNQPQKALSHAQKVLDWGINEQHKFGEAQGNFIMGKVLAALWLKNNDNQALLQANEHYQKALAFSYSLPNKRIDHLVKLTGFAQVQIYMNDKPGALKTLEEALPLAIKIEEWEEEIKTREMLIELIQKDNAQAALEHAKAIGNLSQQHNRNYFSSQLAELLIDHDVVSKQNRIQRISFEKKQLENRQFIIMLAAGFGSLLIILTGGYIWRVVTFKARQKQLQNEVEQRTKELRTSESKYRQLFSETLKEKERTEEALRQERIAIQNNLNFIDMISHEYRTPLTVIDSSLDLLKQGAESPLNSVERMKHSVKKLLHLFETSLSELRVNDDFIIKKTEVINLSVFIKLIVDYARKAFPDHMIRFDAQHLNDGDKVEIDPDLMNIALTNIIDNACKYSPEEQPVTIELSEQKDGDSRLTIIDITDRGRGIDTNELPKIFEKYYRASSGKTEKGTGVGLFLVNRIVEMHGGSIKVQSQLGEGCKFSIALPLTDAATELNTKEPGE